MGTDNSENKTNNPYKQTIKNPCGRDIKSHNLVVTKLLLEIVLIIL